MPDRRDKKMAKARAKRQAHRSHENNQPNHPHSEAENLSGGVAKNSSDHSEEEPE